MKKVLMIIAVLLLIPIMTACDKSNRLICKVENSGITAGYELYFDSDDKLEKVTEIEGYDFSQFDLENTKCTSIEDCLEKSDSALDNCKQNDYYENCRLVKDKSSATIYADISEKGFESFSDMSKGMSKENVVKLMEALGTTCE